jgi:SWIB/MDM2 domain
MLGDGGCHFRWPARCLFISLGQPSSVSATANGSQMMWEYIRSHNLQNPENRREILADDKLRRVFGKDKVTMFEMNKHLAGHLK